MPKHDLPDGNESGSNIIDFREHLRHRASKIPANESEPDSDATGRDLYRFAEHGDGRRPGFSRHDILWLGVIVAIGLIFWAMLRR